MGRGCYIVPPGTYGRRQKARCIISAACPFWRPLRRPTAAPGSISGTIRVDVAGNLARTLLLPALPQFLARYPDITLQIGESERDVDLVREGVDCVIRGGHLPDSEMICRPLAGLQEITCASPTYLARYGTPHTIEGLTGHVMIGFVSSRTQRTLPLSFTWMAVRARSVCPVGC